MLRLSFTVLLYACREQKSNRKYESGQKAVSIYSRKCAVYAHLRLDTMNDPSICVSPQAVGNVKCCYCEQPEAVECNRIFDKFPNFIYLI